MSTTRLTHKFFAFTLAALMTFGVLGSLGALADNVSADAQQMASCMAPAPRA